MKTLVKIAAVAACAGAANAQFSTTFAGPANSVGAFGNVNNFVGIATYMGPSTIFGSLRIAGTLTEVNTATFASEARWNIDNLSYAGGGINYQSTTTGNFTGSLAIDTTFGGLTWANTGDTFRYEAFESFNDSGVDSAWTNTTLAYGAATITDLGFLGAPGTFSFDTFGSSFDTELAVYAADGTLIATNDDAVGLQSAISGAFGAGSFYVIVGGFNSSFANGVAVGGTATGNFLLNYTGGVQTGTLAAGQLAAFSFTTVPAPATAAAFGLGLLAAGRRRR